MSDSAPAGLLGPVEVRRIAEVLQLRPTKTLGQNFVVDPNTVRRIVRTARLSGDDVVVEVGPGLGSLTLGLLPVTRQVIAVEIDPRLAARLPRTVGEHRPDSSERLTVLTGDALRVDGNEIRELSFEPPHCLVANLPYNVAVPVLLRLLEQLPSLRRVLVMVQSEVAERLAAAPASRVYGAPSVKLAWWGRARLAGQISRTVFWPVPNVDSSLVAVERRPDRLPVELRSDTFAAVDLGFRQRRKMLRSALAGWAGSAAAATDLLVRAGIEPTARAEQLSVEQFLRLAAVRRQNAPRRAVP